MMTPAMTEGLQKKDWILFCAISMVSEVETSTASSMPDLQSDIAPSGVHVE
jgi:hypothetical protein